MRKGLKAAAEIPCKSFERELHRLRGYRFKRLLIVGTELEIQQGIMFSRINPKSIFASLLAFEVRYDVPVAFANTPESAAIQVERWAYYFAREVVKNANDLLRVSRRQQPNSIGILGHPTGR